jgi:regulation of enolase protein 1 (concanavalin A-like superfamily)
MSILTKRLTNVMAIFLFISFVFIPVITVQANSGVVSDDFNMCTLGSGVWTLVDPVGDASLSLNGTQALLSVPAGVNHDVWTVGNRAPRLMQAAADEDFEVEVKFESTLDARYQLQGILVEQDDNNFLRFDFYSDGSRTRMFAAKFVNGSPSTIANTVIGATGISPQYMRVTRVGDQWTQAYSLDGVNWTVVVDGYTHALGVTGVGVFVGNAGSNPAHTGVIDYFFNTASPIVPEDAEELICS